MVILDDFLGPKRHHTPQNHPLHKPDNNMSGSDKRNFQGGTFNNFLQIGIEQMRVKNEYQQQPGVLKRSNVDSHGAFVGLNGCHHTAEHDSNEEPHFDYL